MAKKKQGKKHKFKYAEPTTGLTQSAPAAAPAGGAAQPRLRTEAVVVPGGRDFSYVFGDLKRIGILVVSLVTLELVLWYLFTRTGAGDAVYKLIQI